MKIQSEKKSKYNGFLTPKQNYIWAGAMTLAWQQLANKVIKQPIALQSKDHNIQLMIQNYNNSNFLRKDLSSNCYYVKSGYGPQTSSLINKEIEQKFKNITLPKVQQKLQKTDLISYAYIFKRLQFLQQFQKRQQKSFEFNGAKVQSFYAKSQRQKRNVYYYNYKDDDNFLIGIKSKNQNDLIYLLKSQDQSLLPDNVMKTIIYSQGNGMKRYLSNFDLFQAPVIQIQVNRHLSELQGLKFTNQSCKDCYLAKAIEGLKFQMNQKGAQMENYALIVRKKAKISEKQTKKFLLNKPFWLVMKQKGRHPYLCLKIVDPIQTLKQSKKSKQQ